MWGAGEALGALSNAHWLIFEASSLLGSRGTNTQQPKKWGGGWGRFLMTAGAATVVAAERKGRNHDKNKK